MCLRVRGIDKLPGDKAVRRLRGDLLGLGNGALHTLCTIGEDKLRAVGLHQLAALNAHGLWHDDDDAVARGKADAGVAGGGLDDNRVALELAARLGVIKNGLGNAILDRACGVEIFKLCKQLCFELFRLFNVRKLQKRRAADQLVSRSIDLAHHHFLLNDVGSISKFYYLFCKGFGGRCILCSAAATSERVNERSHVHYQPFK